MTVTKVIAKSQEILCSFMVFKQVNCENETKQIIKLFFDLLLTIEAQTTPFGTVVFTHKTTCDHISFHLHGW